MSTKKTTKKTSGKQLPLEEREQVKRNIKMLKKEQDRSTRLAYHIVPGVLLSGALFLCICFLFPDSMGLLKYLVALFSILLGPAKWAIPALLITEAFYWRFDYLKFAGVKKLIYGISTTIFFSIFVFLIASDTIFTFGEKELTANLLGKLIGSALQGIAGFGAWIITILALFLLIFAMFNITILDMLAFVKNKLQEASYNRDLERQARLEEQIKKQKGEDKQKLSEVKEKSATEEAEDAKNMRKRRAFITDEEMGMDGENNLAEEEIKPALSDDNEVIAYGGETKTMVDINAFDAIVSENAAKSGELAAENTIPDGIQDASRTDLAEIFTDDASISMAGEQGSAGVINGDGETEAIISDDVLDSENEPVPVSPEPMPEEIYSFPPINFLQRDPNPLTFAVTDELKQTSIKLVETLRNFGVKTKIMNICCGPTVTRYELQPEVGVRVRSIANLSDDIALHLAASGVRIEAPIPGKDAVGIEIPNKTVSTVYIRNLIESQTFDSQKSKLTVALGMDVAGSPVYMNVAKMPHLLIAGATGMGKSVCINTFIVSMLYKARPDEVKFILIDPKKVELSIYNGLPHLLVPVVSDPKKAAGSLAWAVNEMERRFLLIEEVGVRDIDSYNEVTKEDPEKEYMPKIVIIIDELADLMMTARDEVETSICRLAQKARAAGMHLVIGTQRPSVDVITGLIKANVPSRIACTVASQVDSRTIIDVSGAEKLLGRGDMLYAPVGCMKPTRVQGAFVSEKEIENIVEFLKNGKIHEYNADIIESIEREAAKCGEKKRGRGSADSDEDYGEDRASIIASDDSILPAIEIAVDSGSVSTSLLQRKLSLGYARAARIVDKLEKLGVVGPFEGSKPRKVLITREEYLQMRMTYEGAEE